uniref:interleukin-17C-like n=1 Tax=Semicossyphus pulcher TaxID=241346 RepID=UPI0037E9415D
MEWTGVQMISIWSLLIQTSSAAAGGSRCLSQDEVNQRVKTSPWEKLNYQNLLKETNLSSCADAAKQMRGEHRKRALSPWTYSLNEDQDRIPRQIAFAQCLCDGCIINQEVNLSYNSVQVKTWLVVLRKTRCEDETDKYKLKKELIMVPVGCTCVLPNFKK